MDIDMTKYYWKNDLITLRKPKESDWETLIHHMFESEGRFFINDEIDMPTDIDEYKSRAEFTQPNKLPYICFAIENSEGRHVGVANLFGVDERNGTFGPIGILINPRDRGKGYALATYRMLGRYLFNERRLHKWNSAYIEGNAASAALHEKTGFEIEGLQRDMHFHEGRYWNVVVCGMTEARFFENEKRLYGK